MTINYEELIGQALQARKKSYCPYSKFAVGAALLAKSGAVYTGCNIENGAYGPSNCAERTAFFKAVSEGQREFVAIAIVGGEQEKAEGALSYCYPCGVCRQVMQEFCNGEFKIIVAGSKIDYKVHSLDELLPCSFALGK